MSKREIVKNLNEICLLGENLCEIANTAARNGKSLGSHNFYADKFHLKQVEFGKVEAKLTALLQSIEVPSDMIADFASITLLIQHTDTKVTNRKDSCRKLRTICETKIAPVVEASESSVVPSSEVVLPMDVVRGTRGYFENIIQQANGCYENRGLMPAAL